jgi:hypothetical protein
MKRLFSIAMAVLIIAVTSLFSNPNLEFGCGPVYDFGNVKQKDSPLKATIMLYNTGGDTLIIERVKPMCGCTTAPLSKKVIAPKDSAELKVTLNVEHYEGEIEKKISFQSNFKSQEVFLTLKTNVVIPLKLFPGKYLNFSQMYIGTPTVSKLVINNTSGHDIQITNVTVNNDVTVNLQQGHTIVKDSDFVLEATVDPKIIGPFTCKVDIATNDPDLPSVQISGFGRIDSASEKSAIDENEAPKVIPAQESGKDNKDIKLVTPPVINPNAPAVAVPAEGQGIKMDRPPNMKLPPDNRLKVKNPGQEIKINQGQGGEPVKPSPTELPKEEKK